MSEFVDATSVSQHTKILRDSWLRSYSQSARIGKTYGENGAVLFEGLTPFAWLQQFKVIDENKQKYHLTPIELRAVWIRLAEKYNVAASFHANLLIAASSLEDELGRIESQVIQREIAKFGPGGEFWDETLRKPTQRRPPATVLQEMGKTATADARRALDMLRREAAFFKNCMENLEYQRRCLKDYAELLALDPTTRGLT